MPTMMVAPMIVGTIIADLLIGVGVPLIFLLRYRGQQVRATLEFYDPKWRWTDACPIPVLGLAIASAIAAVTMPLSAIPGTMFLFGVRVSGVPLIFVAVALAILMAVTARQVYRLQLVGWQLAIAVVCIGSASSITTLIRTPMEEIYRAGGMSAQQIQYTSQMTGTATMSADQHCMVCGGDRIRPLHPPILSRRTTIQHRHCRINSTDSKLITACRR